MVYVAEHQELDKAAKKLLDVGSSASLSKKCKKALNEIVQTTKELKDKNLVRKCENFYYPELQKIIETIVKNKENQEIADLCQKTIMEFSEHLKALTTKSKNEQKIFDTVTRCKSIQMMMAFDFGSLESAQEKKKGKIDEIN